MLQIVKIQHIIHENGFGVIINFYDIIFDLNLPFNQCYILLIHLYVLLAIGHTNNNNNKDFCAHDYNFCCKQRKFSLLDHTLLWQDIKKKPCIGLPVLSVTRIYRLKIQIQQLEEEYDGPLWSVHHIFLFLS